jgi:hypothetical protein
MLTVKNNTYLPSTGTKVLKLNPMAGLSGDECRTVRGSCFGSPENRQEQGFTRFVAKSTPTATKLDTHDPRQRELPLKGHRPIWSQSTGKHKNPTSTGFETLEHDLPRSMNSWGIRWNPSVKRLNSCPTSSQRKKNESKWSQNDKSSHTRKGEKEGREEHKRDSQKHLTKWISEDTRR